MPVKPSRLNSAERKELRARLAARASQLRLEIREGVTPSGIADEVGLGSIARDVDELAHVTSALGRIDDPEFGYCVDCGTGIAVPRLMAEPFAERCTRCQQKAEAASAVLNRTEGLRKAS